MARVVCGANLATLGGSDHRGNQVVDVHEGQFLSPVVEDRGDAKAGKREDAPHLHIARAVHGRWSDDGGGKAAVERRTLAGQLGSPVGADGLRRVMLCEDGPSHCGARGAQGRHIQQPVERAAARADGIDHALRSAAVDLVELLRAPCGRHTGNVEDHVHILHTVLQCLPAAQVAAHVSRRPVSEEAIGFCGAADKRRDIVTPSEQGLDKM